MQTKQLLTALAIAALSLSSTACSRDETTSAGTSTTTAGDTSVSTSTSTTNKDGVIEQIVERKIRDGIAINADTIKMRDGKLVLSKDSKEVGTLAADGTLVIDGQSVALNATQRATAQKLHAQALQLTQDAVDIAGAATGVAADAISGGVKLAMSSILRGDNANAEQDFEKKIESTVSDKIKPAALAICKSSNAMETTKQELAATVPAYAKYYVKDEPCDAAKMEREFASRSEARPVSTP